MTSLTVGSRRGMRWQAVQAVGGAALALALAAGIGAWQLHGRDTTAGAPTTSEARTGAAAVDGPADWATDAAMAPVTPSRVAGPEMTYYLVGSRAQADAVQAQVIDESERRSLAGEPSVHAAVTVVGSAEDEARVSQTIGNDYYTNRA